MRDPVPSSSRIVDREMRRSGTLLVARIGFPLFTVVFAAPTLAGLIFGATGRGWHLFGESVIWLLISVVATILVWRRR